MTSSILDQFVNRSRRLYALPAVATQVVELTNRPSFDPNALRDCIENDPALTAKILRVVNSSLFGLSQQVTDLGQALALLGTKPLKLLVLGFSLPKELLTGLEAHALHRYWRRTAIKAVAARELSETLWRMPADEAFIAGLLQDMGTLVLMQDLGDSFLAFLERIYHDGGDLLAFETATLGFDHASLSARLLEQWGWPESIVRDVSQPFDAETLVGLPEQERTVPQVLHLADLVAEFLTRERVSVLNQLLEVGDRYRGVTIDTLESLVAALELKVPQLAEALSLSLPNETAYSTILSRAYADAEGDGCEFGELLQQAQTLGVEIGQFADSGTATMLQNASGPGLLGKVEASVKSCRQARHAVSLALLELDHAESGLTHVHRAMDRLQSMMQAVVDQDGRVIQVADDRFAVIFEGCDRQPAIELTRQLVRSVRQWSATQAATNGHALSLSAGVATLAMPPKNFPCRELIDAAERCLHGAQRSGGDSVKSIDIY